MMKIRMLSLLLVLCIMLSGCSSATPVHAPGSGATDLDSEITQAESAPEQGADEPEPVSYTHLDVYKRQQLGTTNARAKADGSAYAPVRESAAFRFF